MVLQEAPDKRIRGRVLWPIDIFIKMAGIDNCWRSGYRNIKMGGKMTAMLPDVPK
jgi:hypothetical protein